MPVSAMPIAFVHISDIHFGQEKGGQCIVDDDVKECLIDDCAKLFRNLPSDVVRGVIVTGDIAYSGKEGDYKSAGLWLDRLTSAIGCLRSNVFIVPGNHDIDRANISVNCGEMLAAIAAEGDAKLDAYLSDDGDREQLFRRFSGYRLFAEGYDCSIDDEGGLAGDHTLAISEGRLLRFVGLNSALISGTKDVKGRLLLGMRQRVVQRNTSGEELVVLMHHPLDWLQDSEDASDYLRGRARIVMSGHEHLASSRLVKANDGREVLMISAGATVPPAKEGKRYCFNIIRFAWDEQSENLSVSIEPREWNKTITEFSVGTAAVGGEAVTYALKCPNYVSQHATVPAGAAEPSDSAALEAASMHGSSINNSDEDYSLLVLSFFRDIEESERMRILLDLNIIPKTWKGTLTHSLERRFLDKAKQAGKLDEIKGALAVILQKKQ